MHDEDAEESRSVEEGANPNVFLPLSQNDDRFTRASKDVERWVCSRSTCQDVHRIRIQLEKAKRDVLSLRVV